MLEQFISELKNKILSISYDDGTAILSHNIKAVNPQVITLHVIEEITSSTLSILIKLYGSKNSHVIDFIDKIKKYRNDIDDNYQILNCCFGKLNALETDLKFGLLTTMEKQISGEVFGDFIKASKISINEGHKEIAAVLACAALEDCLKRIGKVNGLNLEDKTMNDVVNALKKEGLIKGAQSSLINAYVTLRNKTFHAQWDKLDVADVKSLISFTEQILLQNFE